MRYENSGMQRIRCKFIQTIKSAVWLKLLPQTALERRQTVFYHHQYTSYVSKTSFWSAHSHPLTWFDGSIRKNALLWAVKPPFSCIRALCAAEAMSSHSPSPPVPAGSPQLCTQDQADHQASHPAKLNPLRPRTCLLPPEASSQEVCRNPSKYKLHSCSSDSWGLNQLLRKKGLERRMEGRKKGVRGHSCLTS